MNTITTAIPSKFVRIVRTLAWVGLIVFAIGATVSLPLEEIGAMLALLSFVCLLASGDVQLRRSGIDLPVVLFLLGVITSSILASPDKLNSLLLHIRYYVAILFFYFVISGITEDKFRRSLFILLAVSVIASLYGIFQSLTGLDPVVQQVLKPEGQLFHAHGFTGKNLIFGGLMSMISILFFGVYLKAEDKQQRWTFFSGAVMTAIATFLSFSRGAMIGLVVGYLLFFIVLSIVDRRKLYFLIAFLALVGCMLFSVPDLRQKVTQEVSVDYLKSNYRYEIWITGINMVKANPIFGIGSGQFYKQYDKYKDPSFNRRAMKNAYSDVLEIWIEGGIIGFAGYLLIFVMLVVQGLRRYFKHGNDPLVLALTVSVIVMFIQGLSQSYFSQHFNLWLFWYVAAGLSLLSQKGGHPLAS